MRHIIPISGKDSCATAIVQMTHRPDLQYELFFNDVGCKLPETYEWLDRVEEVLARPICRVGKSLEKVIYKHGILPSAHVRFCTREAKIEPMEAYIGDDQATVYFGICADEQRVGYVPLRANITPVYPLRDMGLGLPQVYQILYKFRLAPPKFFWKTLYDLVLVRLDRDYQDGFRITSPPSEILASLPTWAFDSLFAWRSRSNCYLCFFQRLYEFVGLLEHHPELFERAEEIESELGDDEQRKPFTWLRDYPLACIRRNRKVILLRRAVQVVKFLKSHRLDRDPVDELSLTSCGLFCGK